MRTRVILESPYAPSESATTVEHVEYARRALRDSLLRDEAPFASHLLYTQPGVLDDTVPEERVAGIDTGLLWGRMASKTVCYIDFGISAGMVYGIAEAERCCRPVEYREIGRA